MVVRSCAVVALIALLSLPALAQDAGPSDGGVDVDAGDVADDDAGPAGDAGSADCMPRCEGEVLHFCDDGEPVTLDCTETGATCGLLSEEWGFDCVLDEGAACEPTYADGLSRCEGAGDDPPSNCCVEDVCADPGDVDDCRDFLPRAPERPATANPLRGDDAATSCLGCTDIPFLSFLPLLFGLRLMRRRRR